jgi:hypothetical protein
MSFLVIVRIRSFVLAAWLGGALFPYCAAVPAPGQAVKKTITVDEGTNLALTVSPDHTRVMMDLQGMFYSMPMAGGQAKRITDPLAETSHPNWSPRAIASRFSPTWGAFSTSG